MAGAEREELDTAACAVVEDRLAGRERARHAVHAGVLRDVLELEQLYAPAGLTDFLVPEVALSTGGSQWRAGQLLFDARQLAAMPGALLALEQAVLTVEGSRCVVDVLADLGEQVALQVWQRLLPRLHADAEQQAVRPPARLRQLLRRLVLQVDPAGAIARRRQARAGARVQWRHQQDGSVDLWAFGISGPNAQACLSVIASRSAPIGPADDRSADQRRVDALVDLLLGRDRLTARGGCRGAAAGSGRGAAVRRGWRCRAARRCRCWCRWGRRSA